MKEDKRKRANLAIGIKHFFSCTWGPLVAGQRYADITNTLISYEEIYILFYAGFSYSCFSKIYRFLHNLYMRISK